MIIKFRCSNCFREFESTDSLAKCEHCDSSAFAIGTKPEPEIKTEPEAKPDQEAKLAITSEKTGNQDDEDDQTS